MEKENISQKGNNLKLLVAVAVTFLLLSGTLSYSVHKYNAILKQPAVNNDIAMRVIHHTVKSVCPLCGFKGIPACPRCSVEMYWNGYHGAFVCPLCGNEGFSQCRHCGELMTWVEEK